MTKDELENIPVDVWLIGHMHVPFPESISEGFTECGNIFNAGSHVQQKISNNTEGVCFIIEIDEGKKVKAKKFISLHLFFAKKTNFLYYSFINASSFKALV